MCIGSKVLRKPIHKRNEFINIPQLIPQTSWIKCECLNKHNGIHEPSPVYPWSGEHHFQIPHENVQREEQFSKQIQEIKHKMSTLQHMRGLATTFIWMHRTSKTSSKTNDKLWWHILQWYRFIIDGCKRVKGDGVCTRKPGVGNVVGRICLLILSVSSWPQPLLLLFD